MAMLLTRKIIIFLRYTSLSTTTTLFNYLYGIITTGIIASHRPIGLKTQNQKINDRIKNKIYNYIIFGHSHARSCT